MRKPSTDPTIEYDLDLDIKTEYGLDFEVDYLSETLMHPICDEKTACPFSMIHRNEGELDFFCIRKNPPEHPQAKGPSDCVSIEAGRLLEAAYAKLRGARLAMRTMQIDMRGETPSTAKRFRYPVSLYVAMRRFAHFDDSICEIFYANLRSILDALDPRSKEIILRRYRDRQTVDRAATAIGISVSACSAAERRMLGYVAELYAKKLKDFEISGDPETKG